MKHTERHQDFQPERELLQGRGLPVSISGIFNYLSGKRTPARQLSDAAAFDILPVLTGEVVEIGGRSTLYSKQAIQASSYTLSNIDNKPGFMYLDAMKMHLDDNSVDGYVCISVLEHIPDPAKCILEIHRTLKPGGKLLLLVPFMYPFHADPSDFYRYTDKGLEYLLKDFNMIRAEALGNVFSTLALILQKPLRSSRIDRMRRENRLRYLVAKVVTSPVTIVCRLIGFCFYMLSFFLKKPSDYASMYCVLAEKK